MGKEMKTDMRGLAQRERSFTMTFALRQALVMLQMPQAELAKWLQEEIEKNPLLEWLETPSLPVGEDPLLLEAPQTLQDCLMGQIREHFEDQEDRNKAIRYLEHMDEKGFLIGDLVDDPILSVLQSFYPRGICARTLQECLLLQLHSESMEYQVIKFFFNDLICKRFEKIKKNMKLTNLVPVMKALSRLVLRPADLYKQESSPAIVVDLSISKLDEHWVVAIKEEMLPPFKVRSDYRDFASSFSHEEMESFRRWSLSSKWLVRSLKRRKEILLKIGYFLVIHQRGYFDQQSPMKQLSLKCLAQNLRLHESTVSRALAGKYVATPRGTFSLRFFIHSSRTNQKAKEVLEEIIHLENKLSPITDRELVGCVEKKGVKIARRTITKYRKQLNISSAAVRRHTNFLKNSSS